MLSKQRYRAALATKIKRSLDRIQDPTKIQRSVDRTENLYIFSLTQQRYRGKWMEHTTFIYSLRPLNKDNYALSTKIQRQQHCGSNTWGSPNKDTEATTLWVEHTTFIYIIWLIFNLTYGRTDSCNTSWNNWTHLENIGDRLSFWNPRWTMMKQLWINGSNSDSSDPRGKC